MRYYAITIMHLNVYTNNSNLKKKNHSISSTLYINFTLSTIYSYILKSTNRLKREYETLFKNLIVCENILLYIIIE